MAHLSDDQYADGIGEAASAPPTRGWASVDKVVFGVSASIILVVCLLGMLITDTFEAAASTALGWVTHNVGWLFILGATGFVVFALVLAFGRYGNIPLSSEGEKTEFSTISWVAMMFSAGMGIGLMFFGVYEPVTHLADPPPFVDAAARAPRGCECGHGVHVLPLGAASVGHLRGRRAGPGLLDVPDGERT